ncbi:dihydrolipoyl dehydrogenase [Paenibacillus aurantius]|uniref:Dihydrolipoyl dehydrogenase n=1 Tax=Paenibacillus aurantius TaxID=2918900 RepID=A0AA96RFU6_9BACL|nr:dihydrolipoyl dehydrogenase [Paenibacillus aurantius]WNQ09374.1 dihydrolipoyl dehydrogenase [Paenibacillus aurantius]
MSHTYDIVVLGGGTGGYSAAIRAAQLGMSVALVERDKLGGTCLHRGCIPSKALLRSAEVYAEAKNGEAYGVTASSVTLDFDRVQQRKAGIVDQLYKGLQLLMKKNKIDVYAGSGRMIAPSIFAPRSGTIAVELADGETETLVPGHLILATGSRPRILPGLEPDGELILTSDEALLMAELPESMLIVGGGVIGVEWASMLNDFGVEVTVVEYAPRLVPQEDEDISKELELLFRKRGIRVLTGAKLLPESLEKGEKEATVQVEKDGERMGLSASRILVSVGREANIDSIGLENSDVKVEKGYLKVNGSFQTAEPHIYAVGDAIGGLQLAHAAAHEGIRAVEHIAGKENGRYEPHRVPRCIYTRTEIASVGWTEQQAKERGHDVKTGRFPFKVLGKALVQGHTEGFVKIVADRNTSDLLGVHMIGPHVTEHISEAALAQLLDATPWEVGQSIHPHPTLSEALGEAMLAADGQAIHV